MIRIAFIQELLCLSDSLVNQAIETRVIAKVTESPCRASIKKGPASFDTEPFDKGE